MANELLILKQTMTLDLDLFSELIQEQSRTSVQQLMK